jgi:CRP-like cAMP-binding protein
VIDKFALLREVPLLRACDDELIAVLSRRCDTLRLDAGVVLYSEGDPCSHLWVVGSGAVGVYAGDVLVARRHSGAPVDEAALVAVAPHRHAAVTEAPVNVLLTLDRNEFFDVVRALPRLAICVLGVLGDEVSGEGRYALVH